MRAGCPCFREGAGGTPALPAPSRQRRLNFSRGFNPWIASTTLRTPFAISPGFFQQRQDFLLDFGKGPWLPSRGVLSL
jgi:hypothetical protein